MFISIIFAVLSLLTCVVFCIFRAKKASNFTLTLKALASLFFIFSTLVTIIRFGYSDVGVFILIGMICGLIGDVVLDLKVMYPNQSDTYFLIGTGAFAIGHMCYFISALLFNMIQTPNTLLLSIVISLVLAIALTVAIMLASKKMKLNFGNVKIAVVCYSVLLSFMLFYSISIAIFNPMYWIFAVGMLIFLVSDLILSTQYFGGRKEKSLIYLNHIAYYAAQIIFAVFLLVLMIV